MVDSTSTFDGFLGVRESIRLSDASSKSERSEDFLDEIQQAIIDEALETFSRRVVEEALNPKNLGRIENADGDGRVTGPCGDTIEIFLNVDHERISDVRFMTDGCGPTIASASVLTQLAKSNTIEEASMIEDRDILSVLGGLPAEHIHCPMLAINTLKEAIADYRRRKG